MYRFYYNIYKNHTYEMLGTVAVDAEVEVLFMELVLAPVDRARKAAGEKLHVGENTITAILSTHEQFLKTGI
jgi:hypothetical protein